MKVLIHIPGIMETLIQNIEMRLRIYEAYIGFIGERNARHQSDYAIMYHFMKHQVGVFLEEWAEQRAGAQVRKQQYGPFPSEIGAAEKYGLMPEGTDKWLLHHAIRFGRMCLKNLFLTFGVRAEIFREALRIDLIFNHTKYDGDHDPEKIIPLAEAGKSIQAISQESGVPESDILSIIHFYSKSLHHDNHFNRSEGDQRLPISAENQI